jgi:timeless
MRDSVSHRASTPVTITHTFFYFSISLHLFQPKHDYYYFSFIKEQIKLRENALAQADLLVEYKRAICHHSSHLGPKKEQGGLLSIFVSLLAEPLSKTGTERSDEDHLTIELVLHLFRNLLAAEPLLTTSVEASDRSKQLHDELLALYDREYVLEILLVLGANMEQRENVPYNLLVMELLHHLLRQQDPTAVARSASLSASSSSSSSLPKNNTGSGTNASTSRGVGGQENPRTSTGLLKGHLDREKQTLGSASALTSRHSHFGGTMVVNRPGGKRQYVSAASLDPRRKAVAAAGAPAQRKNKRSEPFIGSGRTLQSHTRLVENNGGGPARVRAQRTLDNFCRRFVKECYGPVMKSLKNEFRRDSVRLEEGDRVVFFRIAWFFCQWWRVSPKTKTVSAAVVAGSVDNNDNKKDDASSENILGQLIFTMDVFTFNLVLNATDTFQEQKKPVRLAQTVALLSEMLHLLHVMYTSNDSTEQIMAMGLMDRLYYGSEALDRLPKLLSKWKEGTSTREYLCDLTEVCHMTLKLLDTHAKSCIAASAGAAKAKIAEHDTVAKMKAAAADFDVSGYFARKIVSNHTVYMYTQLLSQYFVNAPHVNHRIIAFFLRVGKLEVVSPEPIDIEMPQNLLAAKKVTLEPMLYTVHLISVLNTILNDASIRKEKDYTATLAFAVRIVQNFATAAQQNPVLFVEALFKHPLPHRYCELATNSYVSEELRMIAERELLMEEHARFEKEVAATRDEDDEEDEEEELEFEDFGTSSVDNTNTKRVPTKPARRILDDSDDDDDSKPAAKRKSGELEDSDDDGDAVMDEQQAKKAAARSADMQKRLRKLDKDGDSSSDDEELNFDMGQTTGTSSSKVARSFVDDDEDDDNNNEGGAQ